MKFLFTVLSTFTILSTLTFFLRRKNHELNINSTNFPAVETKESQERKCPSNLTISNALDSPLYAVFWDGAGFFDYDDGRRPYKNTEQKIFFNGMLMPHQVVKFPINYNTTDPSCFFYEIEIIYTAFDYELFCKAYEKIPRKDKLQTSRADRALPMYATYENSKQKRDEIYEEANKSVCYIEKAPVCQIRNEEKAKEYRDMLREFLKKEVALFVFEINRIVSWKEDLEKVDSPYVYGKKLPIHVQATCLYNKNGKLIAKKIEGWQNLIAKNGEPRPIQPCLKEKPLDETQSPVPAKCLSNNNGEIIEKYIEDDENLIGESGHLRPIAVCN